MVNENLTIKPFDDKIWLSSPIMHGEEMEYIQEAYDKNWVTTLGENVTAIEKAVCEKVGCKYAVSLSCGTAALHLAVKLADVKPGDRVFCSDMTFGATVNPVVYEDAVPVFIDTEYDTWNMDPVALEKAVKRYPDVKVLVIANLYGVPPKFDEILDICKRNNITVIEDAAESFGASYKEKQTGTFGNYNAISFNGNKIITGSSGGMLLTDSKIGADRVLKWSTQARENAPWYQHKEIGYNYRMSNIVAGIVRGQLPYLDEHIEKKKAIYERYKEGLKDLPLTMNPFLKNDSKPNFWLSCILIDKNAMCKVNRTECEVNYIPEKGKSCPDEIMEQLAKYNVESRPIWKPMHMQPVYLNNDFVTCEDGVDVGMDIFSRGLCLPSDIKMTPEQQGVVIEIVKSCFE